MAIFRNVNMSFWTDPKVVDDYTPEDRYFMLYALTNNYTNIIGCYEISIKQMSNDLGYTKDVVENLLKRFMEVHKTIEYDFDTKELLVVNWNKYNWSSSPKLDVPLYAAIENVKSDLFHDKLAAIYNDRETVKEKEDTVSIPYEYGMETSVTVTDTVTDSVSVSDFEKMESKIEIAKRIVDMYHIQCPSLPKVMKLTDARIKAIMARLKDYSEDEIETAFVKAENSPFLRGEKGDWKAGFDWFMKPGNLCKVLEGNYDDNVQGKKNNFNAMLEEWAKGGNQDE